MTTNRFGSEDPGPRIRKPARRRNSRSRTNRVGVADSDIIPRNPNANTSATETLGSSLSPSIAGESRLPGVKPIELGPLRVSTSTDGLDSGGSLATDSTAGSAAASQQQTARTPRSRKAMFSPSKMQQTDSTPGLFAVETRAHASVVTEGMIMIPAQRAVMINVRSWFVVVLSELCDCR